jgi:hypothetical protein
MCGCGGVRYKPPQTQRPPSAAKVKVAKEVSVVKEPVELRYVLPTSAPKEEKGEVNLVDVLGG